MKISQIISRLRRPAFRSHQGDSGSVLLEMVNIEYLKIVMGQPRFTESVYRFRSRVSQCRNE